MLGRQKLQKHIKKSGCMLMLPMQEVLSFVQNIGKVIHPKYYKHLKKRCYSTRPQILREKTLSQKYTVIALRIQWKLSAEGNAFRKCQQIILPLIIINAIIFGGHNLS